MPIQLYIAEDPNEDKILQHGHILGNITRFSAACNVDDTLRSTYEIVGASLVKLEYSVENSAPPVETHPLLIKLGDTSNDVEVKYEDKLIGLITSLTIDQRTTPRTRLIRITVLNIDDELRNALIAFKGVEVVIDHAAREAATGIEETTHK